MIMFTSCICDSEFDVTNDGELTIANDISLAVGYRVAVDGQTGVIRYQPFVGNFVSPFSFSSVEEAQEDVLRMIGNVVSVKGLAIPQEEAVEDLEKYIDGLRELAGIAQGDDEVQVVQDRCKGIGDEGPFVTDQDDELVCFGIVAEAGQLLANDYRNFKISTYLENLDKQSVFFDGRMRSVYAGFCQLKEEDLHDLNENIVLALRQLRHDDAILRHLRLVLNGGMCSWLNFYFGAERTLELFLDCANRGRKSRSSCL